MTGGLISVVIPTYNYGHYVTDAVTSALAQTYRPTEIIVVDDGSTDTTRQRLAPFRDMIRYIHQTNQGLSAARNTGICAAQGEWIALLDSDDTWHPRKLEAQQAYLARHPEVALLGTDLVADTAAGWPDLPEAEPAALPVTLEELVYSVRFAPSSALLRKRCFDEVGLFDTELRSAEDRDMWIRIVCRFPVAKLLLPLCWYRIHATNMSRVAARMEENERRVLQKAFATVAALRGRRLFRRKTYSYAAFSAAYMYGAARQWFPALTRLLRSFLLWPLPFRRSEVDGFLARPRLLAVTLLRTLRIKRPEPIPAPALGEQPLV